MVAQDDLNNQENIQAVLRQASFTAEKEIYRCYVYGRENLRDLVLRGIYRGQSACIKIYKIGDITGSEIEKEATNFQRFNTANRSVIIKAPELLANHPYDGQFGWFITSYIAGGKIIPLGVNFSTAKQKEEIARCYLDYRFNFPKAWRKKQLREEKGAEVIIKQRIKRWEALAKGRKSDISLAKGSIKRAKDIIGREYGQIKLWWTHGHFCNREIIKTGNLYYLTDFAHVKYYPELYELALVIWSLSLENNMERITAESWIEEIKKWESIYLSIIAPAFDYDKDDFKKILRLNILERSLGAILADIGASDRPPGLKKEMLEKYKVIIDYLISFWL